MTPPTLRAVTGPRTPGCGWRPVAASVAVAVIGAAVLGGCGGASTPSSAGVGGTTTAPAPTTSIVSTSSSISVPGSTTTPAVRNLVVDDTLRAQLLQAGAAMNSLPASAYTGLVPGTTYYAYDSLTGTYWAGAGLVPSPSSRCR